MSNVPWRYIGKQLLRLLALLLINMAVMWLYLRITGEPNNGKLLATAIVGLLFAEIIDLRWRSRDR